MVIDCIVVAIDAKKLAKIGTFLLMVEELIPNLMFLDGQKKLKALGAGEILLTSMDRDGTQKGFDVELTKRISEQVNIPVIASGGIGTLDHFSEGVKKGSASALLAASVFHFGKNFQ